MYPPPCRRRPLLGGTPPYSRGPRSGPGCVCPGPSPLSRPHPPHSQAHRNFIALRLICDAFAVRERLGDPRVVPGFRCTFHPDMPSPTTPGSLDIHEFQSRDVDIGLHHGTTARHPKYPAIRFARDVTFRGLHGSLICYGLSGCSAPCTDLTGLPANGAFYFQAFSGSVARPAAGYNYSIDWTPALAVLAPAGLTTSFAARSHRTWRADFPHHALRQLIYSTARACSSRYGRRSLGRSNGVRCLIWLKVSQVR